MSASRRAIGGLFAACLTGCTFFSTDVGAPNDAAVVVDSGPPVSFANDIRPLMDRSSTDPTGHGCKACHYPSSPNPIGYEETGLDLSTLGTLRKGGKDTGTNIVIPGNPAGSALVQKLQGTYEGARMPKDGPPFWSDDEIQLVVDWIAQGAPGEDSE